MAKINGLTTDILYGLICLIGRKNQDWDYYQEQVEIELIALTQNWQN